MSKTTNASKLSNGNSNNQKTKSTKNNNSLIPQRYQDVMAILLLTVLLIIFFKDPLLGDKSFVGGVDNMSGQTMQPFLKASKSMPLWVPYIFGGTPNFGGGFRIWDIPYIPIHYTSVVLKEIFDSDLAMHIIWYIILVSGMYFLMRQHKMERLISFFTAFAFIFGTGIIIWVVIGHLGKPYTFGVVPWIFVLMERIKERVTLLNAVLMTLLMHIMLEGNHVQMIFYAACGVGIYLICELVYKVATKTNWQAVVKLIGVFVIATAFAALMSADKYFVLLEYTPYSIRGQAPITERIKSDKTHEELSSKSTQSDYEYSTMWSNSPEELIDLLFMPSYHGFGRVEYPGQAGKVSTYWGQKPFEDATPYAGAIVMFLAFLGIVRYFRHNLFVAILTIILFFAILLSFGYTFPILYDIFFYYFPKFSSFRAPVMVVILVHLTSPILAGFGLKALCDMHQQCGSFKVLPKTDKVPVMLFFGVIALFVLSGFIFSTSMETSYISDVMHSKLKDYYPEQALSSLASFAFENAVSDWTVIGFLSAIMAILSYLFISKKVNIPSSVFLVAIILITMIDLWRISYRALEFSDKSIEKQPFPRTDIVNFIKEDEQRTGERFRVADFASPVANSAAYFFIENINGYHPAKLRVFQDMMDVMCGGSTSNVTHPFMWNLMNAKYIISGQKLEGGSEPIFQSRQTGAFVYYNPSYCKRVFFVDSFKIEDDYSILQHLNASDFNPKTLAYVEKQPDGNIEPSYQYEYEMKELEQQIRQQFDSTFKLADTISNNVNAPVAKIVDYQNEYIKIETETQAQHLLVLSDLYYPMWFAYVDNKPTEIYKTNFAFRSVIVPAGKHTIEFKFISDSFSTGQKLSASTNILITLALVAGILFETKRRKKQNK